ncbi:caspase-like [Anopheles bellator]|uniref:caspase-like n=1 Tax=Anopheles bellator TaxID=139047 RepID=UPI00264A2CF4|nr:caspase-like [Anopheles bellator]
MNPDVIDSRTVQGFVAADRPTAVQSVTTSLEQFEYKMNHERRGVALIFNHVKFKNAPTRHGSNKDADDLKKALLALGFHVRVYVDLTQDQVFEKLELASKKEDHNKNDCLVVVMMTHGETGTLLAADTHATNRPPYKVERLWEHFVGDACPGLVGKPKLVFIQACRGEQLDPGLKTRLVRVADTVDARGTPEDRGEVYSIPTMADLLVVYSTYDGHYSWRNPTNGSWFIQSLANNLTKYGSKLDVQSLLTVVLRNVACSYQSCVPGDPDKDQMKQMPCVVSTLTKAVHFR